VNNKNAFLDMMDGVIAGKTGFTADAGYCYTAALSVDGKSYVIALLGCGWPNNKSYKWSDAKKLFQYGMENYEYREIDLSGYTELVDVRDGVDSASEEVEFYSDESIGLLLSDEEELEIELEIPDVLEAPVEKSLGYGTLKVSVNGYELMSFTLYPEKDVYRYDYDYCLRYLYEYIFDI
jgi:D-alanyl-D-alanine carboxypeptidase (penicillin-binding protein 5/6)